MDVSLEFICCGISPRPACLDVIEELSVVIYSSSNYALIGTFDERHLTFSVKHIFTGFKGAITCLRAHYQSGNSECILLVFGDSKGYFYYQFISISELEQLSPLTKLANKMCSICHFKSSLEWVNLKVVNNDYFVICGTYDHSCSFIISNHEAEFHKDYQSNEVVLCGDFIHFPNALFLLFGTQRGRLVIAGEEQNAYRQIQSLQCSHCWLTRIAVSKLFDDKSTCMIALGDAEGKIEFYRLQLASDSEASAPVYLSFDIFNLYKEGTIQGHEFGHVYDMGWFRNVDCEGKPLMLYTTGDDRTVVIWSRNLSPSGEHSWSDYTRFGIVDSSTRHGFFGCKHINGFFITYTGNGALYCWQHCSKTYQLHYLSTGHASAVNCIQWLDQPGMMFVTSSNDFTSRIFEKTDNFGWIEVSRPQSHGFEVNSIFMTKDFKLFSAAAEKMIRVFRPTLNFYKITACFGNDRRLYDDRSNDEIPISASLRRLGLSNQVGRDNPSGEGANEELIHDLNHPLNEEQLSSRTLWPEEDKLYGHSDQIVIVAGNERLNHLASATVANNEETASILIWNMDDGKLICKLRCHRLTVFHICYSRDGNYLLSVSRDRTWFVHEIIENEYIPIVSKEDLPPEMRHSRLILCADWCLDSKTFATGGKDNLLIFRTLTDDMQKPFRFLCRHELNSPITAISFSRTNFICGVGTERGEVELYKRNFSWECVYRLPLEICPTMMIKHMQWNFAANNEILGVASEDSSVRLYNVSEEKF